jgi:uncharacterized protein YkwD
MPAVLAPSGRHRKRRTRTIAFGAGLVVLVVTAAIALANLPSSGETRSAGGVAASPTAHATSAPPSPTAAATKPAATSTTSAGSSAVAKAYLADLEAALLVAVNAERAKAKCPALHNNPKLALAARDHSVDMAIHGVFDHTGSDGSDPAGRMKADGYDTSYGWAENIAWGYTSVAAVMAGWMASKPHRDNILNCGMRSSGVGVVRSPLGTIYWTQDLGGV